MESKRMVGLVLLVVGLILLYFGYQASQSIGDQLTEAVTGQYTDSTMWYIIGGAAAIIGGLYLSMSGR